MEKSITEYKIFYSWQSDCDEIINKRYIREQLESAIKRINENKKGKIKIEYDEATRKTVGSHNIKTTLFEKIDASDYFIADVTPVINQYKYFGMSKIKSEIVNRLLNLFDYKAVSNSNVMFELGYAVNKLGWERVILVWNSFYGKVESAPFDIRGHSTLTYYSTDGGKNDELKNKLFDEISKLIKYKPLKVTNKDLETVSNADVMQKTRDIENLNHLFSYVDFESLNQIFNEGVGYIRDDVLVYWEYFDAIVKNVNYRFYNVEINNLIKDIHGLWDAILAYPQYYDLDVNGNIVLRRDTHLFDQERYSEFKKVVRDNIPVLKEKVEKLLDTVRKEYIEVDINEKRVEARKKLMID